MSWGALPILVYLSFQFLFPEARAQEGMSGPAAVDKYSFGFEHQSMGAPAGYPGLDVQEQKLSINIPVYKHTDGNYGLIVRGQRTVLGEHLRFPGTGIDIPDEFGTADIGLGWSREQEGGNKIGMSATYGEAGTRLFTSESSPIVSATVVVERKVESGNSWLYFLNYSNNRTILNNIPLPGIAYAMNGATYNAIFGLPFIFLNWRPGKWVSSTTISPFSMSSDLGVFVWGPLQVYGNFGWLPKAYQNLVKGNGDRLIFDKKEAGGGLRIFLKPGTSFSLGYINNFDRRFLLGDSLDDRQAEKLSVGDAPGLQLRMRASF